LRSSKLRCDACGEVIGVYEPMVVVSEGEARETSRTAEAAIGSQPGQHYHRACFLESAGVPGSVDAAAAAPNASINCARPLPQP
jgi:hypothetical protein